MVVQPHLRQVQALAAMSAFQCCILTFAESQVEVPERPKSFRFFKLGEKTTQQLNYMMEAYDRQFDEARDEGAGAQPEAEAEQAEPEEEEEVPEGVRRFYRHSKVRVSFTYAQNYQYVLKKTTEVGGRRVFILKSVSGQMTHLWVEVVSSRVVQLCLRPTLQGVHVQALSLAGRQLAEARLPPNSTLKSATAALQESMDLSSAEASLVKFVLGSQAAAMDRPLRSLSTVINDLRRNR